MKHCTNWKLTHTHLAAVGLLDQQQMFLSHIMSTCIHRHKELRQTSKARAAMFPFWTTTKLCKRGCAGNTKQESVTTLPRSGVLQVWIWSKTFLIMIRFSVWADQELLAIEWPNQYLIAVQLFTWCQLRSSHCCFESHSHNTHKLIKFHSVYRHADCGVV